MKTITNRQNCHFCNNHPSKYQFNQRENMRNDYQNYLSFHHPYHSAIFLHIRILLLL